VRVSTFMLSVAWAWPWATASASSTACSPSTPAAARAPAADSWKPSATIARASSRMLGRTIDPISYRWIASCWAASLRSMSIEVGRSALEASMMSSQRPSVRFSDSASPRSLVKVVR
jgi:hypothetical protein